MLASQADLQRVPARRVYERVVTQKHNGQEFLEGVKVKREPMTKVRRLTAEHMLRSVRVSPHVTTTFEIDLYRVRQAKDSLGAKFSKQYGSKLSYTAFFFYAAVQGLKKFPVVNASIDGDDILYKEDINLGCAVAVEEGLVVPVLKGIQDSSLDAVGLKLNTIVAKARKRQLTPEDIKGGTFSITNPGMYGSLHSQPINHQPQVAILSVGSIVDRPLVWNGDVVVHPSCQVGLTFDHRLIDGEIGAKFLAEVKRVLESAEDILF